MFAELFESGEHRGATIEVHLRRIGPEAEGSEEVERALGFFLTEMPEVTGAENIQGQAHGDGLAVREAMIRHRFELVRGPVAEVERTRATEFKGVAIAGNVAGVQFCRAADGASDGRNIASSEEGGLLLEVTEEDGVLKERNLDGFDEAVAEAAGIERSQQAEVVHHCGGDDESACEVLLPESIDAVLHADAGVALTQSRGGHAHETDSPVGGGRGETDRIEERTAADGEDVGVTANLIGLDGCEGGFDHSRVLLGRFAPGQHQRRPSEVHAHGLTVSGDLCDEARTGRS